MMVYFIPVALVCAGPGPQSVLLLGADAVRIYCPLFSLVLLHCSARCHPHPYNDQLPGPRVRAALTLRVPTAVLHRCGVGLRRQ